MKILALLPVDMDRDIFGAPSRLDADLGGRPVLTRTAERLSALEGVGGIVVTCKPEQQQRVSSLVTGTKAKVLPHPGGVGVAMRVSRSFGRYGWRGGLAGTTVYDELFSPTLIGALCDSTDAEAFYLVPAGAPLLALDWAEAMIRQFCQSMPKVKVCFSPAPPGLTGGIFARDILQSLAGAKVYPGRLFSYDPTNPIHDPLHGGSCFKLRDEFIATYSRLVADNPRGLWVCGKVLESAGDSAGGEAMCLAAQRIGPEPWPRELTIELTTRRPLEDDLRPTADRPDLSPDRLAEALDGLDEAGDLNIMFAGAGDGLLHPDWPEAVKLARQYGTVGLATYGTDLSEEVCDRLFDCGLDILQVYIDAYSDELYAAFKRGGSASDVWAGVEKLQTRRREAGAATPFVIPTALKTYEFLPEQDEFFERCLKLTGHGTIVEPSDAAGQWPDRAVVHMAPPTRVPCRRLGARLTLLADGRIAMCEEDIAGLHPLAERRILDAWRGETLASLRALHDRNAWDEHPLCSKCAEFHRP